MLRRLLELQKETSLPLISIEELRYIDYLWDNEGDLSRRCVVEIYFDVFGEKLPWDDYKRPVYEKEVIDEIKKCLNNDISLGAIFLIGSILEGLLLDVAKRNPEKFNKSKSAPKDSDGNIKKFKDWSLNSLIDVAYETNFIGLDVKKFSHSLRDFRNYIHPEEQVAQNFNPDKNTALIAYNVLLAAMEDLNKQNNKY